MCSLFVLCLECQPLVAGLQGDDLLDMRFPSVQTFAIAENMSANPPVPDTAPMGKREMSIYRDVSDAPAFHLFIMLTTISSL